MNEDELAAPAEHNGLWDGMSIKHAVLEGI